MANDRYDLASENNGEIAIRNGDFYGAISDKQHIKDTINAWPGWWKEYPLDGVAVSSYEKSSGQLQLLARKIRIELTSDGYKMDNPVIQLMTDGKLYITPNASR